MKKLKAKEVNQKLDELAQLKDQLQMEAIDYIAKRQVVIPKDVQLALDNTAQDYEQKIRPILVQAHRLEEEIKQAALDNKVGYKHPRFTVTYNSGTLRWNSKALIALNNLDVMRCRTRSKPFSTIKEK